MKIKKVYETAKLNRSDVLRHAQNHARICYAGEEWDELLSEKYDSNLVEKVLLQRGHHSPFGHDMLNFYISDIPKIGAMVLNNQAVYNTSEKSARYTEMGNIDPEQKVLYDKWSGIFSEKIAEIYPTRYKDREVRIKKMAQENARYVTSVFTPTHMSHSLTVRDLNIVVDRLTQLIENNPSKDLQKALLPFAEEFINAPAVQEFILPGLIDKYPKSVGAHFFGDSVKEQFGDVYATNLNVSFASFAQLHRHRTITHRVFDGYQQGAPLGFFVPPIIKGTEYVAQWDEDLRKVAENDFPQAQLISISERANKEDLQLKSFERICGLAQLETAQAVKKVIDKFAERDPSVSSWGDPKCLEDVCEKGGCPFGASLATERKI